MILFKKRCLVSFKETINILVVLQLFHKVEPTQLSPPQDVRVESVNLRNVLHWSPLAETVEYAVQYWFDDVVGWKNVPSCTLTSAVSCDFTSVASPSVCLILRVRAESGNHTSTWSTSEQFCASEQTRLGPPGVKLLASPSTLLVQINDTSPELWAEYESALKYRVFYWERSDDRKKHHEGSSSIVKLESLKVGGNYCVQVQYVMLQKEGDLSGPDCAIVPASEEEKRTLLMVLVVVVVILMGMLICACLFAIHKNYDFLKRVLQPSIGLPDHIHRFFEGEEFQQLSDSTVTTPDPEDSVTLVVEDEGEEEEEEEGPSSSFYASPLQELEGQFPASSSPDLESGPSAPCDPQP